jgi:hypothetical protein
MTQATKVASIEEYMALVKDGGDLTAFINECFGTEDDFDNVACDAFADTARAPLDAFLAEEVAKMPEATPEMVEAHAVEAAADTGSEEA